MFDVNEQATEGHPPPPRGVNKTAHIKENGVMKETQHNYYVKS